MKKVYLIQIGREDFSWEENAFGVFISFSTHKRLFISDSNEWKIEITSAKQVLISISTDNADLQSRLEKLSVKPQNA